MAGYCILDLYMSKPIGCSVSKKSEEILEESINIKEDQKASTAKVNPTLRPSQTHLATPTPRLERGAFHSN